MTSLDRKKNWIWFGISLVFAIPLIVYGFSMYLQGDMGSGMIGLSLVLIGCVIFGPFLTRIIAEAFGGGLFYGSRSYAPKPMYKVPQAHILQGRYEVAVEEYQKIIDKFPIETEAWIGMYRVLWVEIKDAKRAGHVLDQALGHFEVLSDEKRLKRKDRELLAAARRSIQAACEEIRAKKPQ